MHIVSHRPLSLSARRLCDNHSHSLRTSFHPHRAPASYARPSAHSTTNPRPSDGATPWTPRYEPPVTRHPALDRHHRRAACNTDKMVRQVQPLRISKPASTASPDKQAAMSRPLAEISSGSTRRNSPSYNQSTRVSLQASLRSIALANVNLARKCLSLRRSTRMLLLRQPQRKPHLATSGPHVQACRPLAWRLHPTALSRLPPLLPCPLGAAPASKSFSPLVG